MNQNVKHHLGLVLGHVDFTQHCCRLTALVGAAIPPEILVDARAAAVSSTDSPEKQALLVLLDQVDYTVGACGAFDMVGACIPTLVLDKCHKAME